MSDEVFEIKIPAETEVQSTEVQSTEETTTQEVLEDIQTDLNEPNVDNNEFNPLDYLKNQEIPNVENTTDISEKETEKEIKPEVKNDAYSWAEKNKRNPEDYFKLHKDWNNESDELALRTYLKEKYPYYSDQEIEDEINDNFGVEEYDEDNVKSKKTREYKKEIALAKSYLSENFNSTSSKNDEEVSAIPQEYQQAFEILEQQKEFQKQGEKARASYVQELENSYKDFKGFDFGFDVTNEDGTKTDVALTFVPTKENLQNTIDVQKDTNKLLESHLEFKEDGSFDFKDSKDFFKKIAFATNMNEILRMVYEQGASSATEKVIKNDLKNVNHSNPDRQNNSATNMKFSIE